MNQAMPERLAVCFRGYICRGSPAAVKPESSSSTCLQVRESCGFNRGRFQGISHAVLTVLADGRLKCDFTEHAKTKNSSIKTSFVMYLTKVTEDDVEAAKNSAENENTKEAEKEAEPEAEDEGDIAAEDEAEE